MTKTILLMVVCILIAVFNYTAGALTQEYDTTLVRFIVNCLLFYAILNVADIRRPDEDDESVIHRG